jgi:molecular chaperone GrpE
VADNKDAFNGKGNGSAANDASEASESGGKVEELQALVEKYKNDFLYLRADFDNYKKNALKERSDYLKYGSERLIVEMLNVLDNFERALETKTTAENYAHLVKGVEMTAQELRAVLQRFGVAEIQAKGLPFDPTIHEALSSEESKELPAGHVVRVFKKPYKLHDKVIRPGQVVVAKQPSQ